MSAPDQARRTFLAGLAAVSLGGTALSASCAFSGVQKTAPAMSPATFSSPRHTTRYWIAGPEDGPLMIFVHGWPGNGLMWRAQVEAFAAQGWRCVAPDMRGYGASSAPAAPEAYAISQLAQDMIELHGRAAAAGPVSGFSLRSPSADGTAPWTTLRLREATVFAAWRIGSSSVWT